MLWCETLKSEMDGRVFVRCPLFLKCMPLFTLNTIYFNIHFDYSLKCVLKSKVRWQIAFGEKKKSLGSNYFDQIASSGNILILLDLMAPNLILSEKGKNPSGARPMTKGTSVTRENW